MLADQHKRDEFTKNLAQNFSVIASPGTGKTTAITDRIVNLVCSEVPLKNFIAVTYTDKAAKEIKERVYEKILTGETVSEVTLKNLEGIFFGTIHGFCAKFLREHCGKAHLNKDFEIIDDDRDLWHKFTSQINKIIDKIVPIGLRDCLANHFKLGKILLRAREITAPTTCGERFVPPPMEDIAEILAYEASTNEDKIRNFQRDVKLWVNSEGTCLFPEIPKVREQNFSKHCSEKIQTYLQWKSEMECYLANKINEEYIAFKIAHNSLGYNELTNLTLKILADKEYREEYVQDYAV
ncbi:MAG: UvrD-helicase domain-containing protein, partial [Puniceicoccales bacterium]|nr:UvrD-helicase domain-containing protein [Puniceicoccales bacterium]